MRDFYYKILMMDGFLPNYRYDQVVKTFFKNEIKAKNIPKQVVDFYARCNGFTIMYLLDVFSLERIKKESKEFLEFIEDMQLEDDMKEYNLIPIADDGMDGYYVFKSNVKDDHIYYLDTEHPEKVDNCFKYKDLKDFLQDLYDNQKSFNKEDD